MLEIPIAIAVAAIIGFKLICAPFQFSPRRDAYVPKSECDVNQ
jgi:hypothetical protein